MSDAAFDVLGILDELKGTGFNEAQTRAPTHSLQSVASTRQGDVATKGDIASVKSDLAQLEVRLLKAIDGQQRWTLGVMVVLVGVLFAAIRLV